MAAPKKEVLFVYDLSTGEPLTGNAGNMSFSVYKNDSGVDLSQPTITEIGGGAYSFTISFPDSNTGVVYIVDNGPNTLPPFLARYARPQDWNEDNADFSVASVNSNVTAGREMAEGKWRIDASAKTLTLYATDGTTILQVYNLLDSSGNPTVTNPFTRIPTLSPP